MATSSSKRRSSSSLVVPSPSRLIPQLPDEISILCIARVPRFLHPTLALVSRSWRSFLNSPLLFSLRSDLGLSQPFLYLRVSPVTAKPFPGRSRWYVFDRDPQNPRRLTPLLPSPPILTEGYSCVALGPTIFILGGYGLAFPSSAVHIFDARFNRWTSGPRMCTTHEFSISGAIGGRIYVVGGEFKLPSNLWAEVLDPGGIGKWAPFPAPYHVQAKWNSSTALFFDDKLYLVTDEGGVVFDPAAEPCWGNVSKVLGSGLKNTRVAVVDGVIYSLDMTGYIKGYDPTVDEWNRLEGWDLELAKIFSVTRLTRMGGVFCLNWEEFQRGKQNPKFLSVQGLVNFGGILCAIWSSKGVAFEFKFVGIKVSTKSCGGLSGSIVWFESVVLPLQDVSVQDVSLNHCLLLEL